MDSKSIIVLLAIITYVARTDGHGMMCEPRQRGAYVSQKCLSNKPKPQNPKVDYCAHCLNGGTVATVRANLPASGWSVYDPNKDLDTAKRAGLCGDPVGRTEHMIGGDFMPYDYVPINDVYKRGSTIDFMIEIDTNHNGYFEFFLCDLDKCKKGDIDLSCFNERTRKSSCYKLERVPHPDCENTTIDTSYECSPIDPIYPSRFYVPCRNTGHVGIHLVGGETGTMRYQLPPKVTCNHCVVQWYWATANSCNPRGMKEYFTKFGMPFGNTCQSDGGGLGAHNPRLQDCGGTKVPEEFWSCADIQITRSGRSAGPVKANKEADEDEDSKANDGDKAKDDPDGTIDDGQDEMEDDINDEADEDKKDEEQEEKDAEKGKCLLEDDACDATIPCCDVEQVCVYTIKSGGFTCRFWWALWEEVHDQRSKRESEGWNST